MELYQAFVQHLFKADAGCYVLVLAVVRYDPVIAFFIEPDGILQRIRCFQNAFPVVKRSGPAFQAVQDAGSNALSPLFREHEHPFYLHGIRCIFLDGATADGRIVLISHHGMLQVFNFVELPEKGVFRSVYNSQVGVQLIDECAESGIR